jgi:hypothetical protein
MTVFGWFRTMAEGCGPMGGSDQVEESVNALRAEEHFQSALDLGSAT